MKENKLKIGDNVPLFEAKAVINDNEIDFSLKDYSGKKLVIYFYPKDLSPGCTTQAVNLAKNFKELSEFGITIIGISKDSIKSHLNFNKKKELPFILVSDEDLSINKLLGVWQLKKFMGKEYMGTLRTTFLINESGKIVNIIEKPKVKNHTNEILEGFML